MQEYERFGAKFFDVDGTEKDIFTLLKDHGFNAIRLKTFVSPKAQYGYAAAAAVMLLVTVFIFTMLQRAVQAWSR